MPRTRSRVYRRPDSPFWWACYSGPDGRPVRQSTGCRDRSSADAWLAVRELERVRADAGIPVARPVQLLTATADYLAEREVEWSAKWWGTVEGFVRLQVVPHFGASRTVSSITREDVARFRTAQVGRPSARGKAGKPVSASTVNRLMWAMAAWGAWCVERAYHTENPWSGHDNLPEDQLPPPAVEAAQLEQLLAALEDPSGPLPSHGRRPNRFPWRALFEVAVETGLRRGELGRLARADIDRAERRAWIVSSHARGHNKARRLRSVALSRRALAVIDAQALRQDGLVFGPVPDPRRAFARGAKAAGLGRVWLHLMRHTGATRIGRAGASLADLMGFGGWASVKMAQRYTHTDHRRQLELVDRASEGHDRGTEAKPGGQDLS